MSSRRVTKIVEAAAAGALVFLPAGARAQASAEAQGDQAMKAGDPEAALLAYARALGEASGDPQTTQALEDKAISAAVRLERKPPVPDEAKDIMARGKAYADQAQNVQDYDDAVSSMKKALLLAPWWATGHYNAALAEQADRKFQAALRDFQLYLKLNPDAPDKESVRQKMAELSVRMEKEARRISDAGIEWVRIPSGSFRMGTDGVEVARPAHVVSISEFEMAKTLVTNRQYASCVKAGACTPQDGPCFATPTYGRVPDLRGDDQPAVCVSWDQARAFSQWAGGRLPSEAEWEYAARSAGMDWRYPWGNASANCDRAVLADDERNAFDNTTDQIYTGCGRYTTWPVCSKPQGNSKQGLCDMAGNVWEWVQDGWHESYSGAPADGSAWDEPSAAYRVIRGGSWITGNGRADDRGHVSPSTRAGALGFRLARSVARAN